MQDIVVELRDAHRGFYGNPVLKGVSIALQRGRVHALLGENGAGKSTLINLVSGVLQPDSGTLLVDGREVRALDPRGAAEAGIAVVQQELSLTGTLSVAENIGMGAFPRRRFGLIDYRELSRRTGEVLALVGLDVAPATPLSELSLGQRQMVEIAKALYRRPRVLILDEPTSSLSAHEVATLSALMARLRAEGLALLFISHRLGEVRRLCNHVTVLKDGTVTADRPMQGLDEEEMVRLMVGRHAGELFPPRSATPVAGPERLSIRGFCAGRAQDVDLVATGGEIVGLGGLVGQGQEDFLLGLFGASPAKALGARIGTPIHNRANAGSGRPFRSVHEAVRAGLAYVPADRKHEGLVLPHSIAANLLLPAFGDLARGGLRRPIAERARVADLARRLSIRGDPARPVRALSGGNQQKVALAKWLPREPGILLLNDPTRGVDVDTKREIYLLLRAAADQGRLILMASSDTLELTELCDRVVVFREGRVATVLAGGEITEEAIVTAAMAKATEARAA